MAWTKAKIAIIATAGALVALGTASVAVRHYQEHRTYPWQIKDYRTPDIYNKNPRQVKIVPTRFPAGLGQWSYETAGGFRSIGIASSFAQLIQNAFNVSCSNRMILPPDPPNGKYDYIASFPKNSREALQSLIQSQFHLSAHFEDVETNVFYLRTKPSGPTGLKHPRLKIGTGYQINDDGHLSMQNASMDYLATILESNFLLVPVLDQTHLPGGYDFNLTWNPSNPDSLQQALSDQLGLELVPGRDTVKFLVVEPAKH